MKLENIVLDGRYVRLEPMTREMVPDLFIAAQPREIWSYMTTKAIETEQEMAQLVDMALVDAATGKSYPFVIRQKSDQRIVGSTRFLDIHEADKGLEIGWTWLHTSVWRTVVNTECKYLLLRYCFETLKFMRVQLKTDARNVNSQRAIERIGGTREGTLRKHRILPDGYIRDSVYFSIVDDEWPKVKANLEAMIK